MNTYLTKSKVELIKQSRKDLYEIYGIDYTPFTRKIYFYFFELDGKKYVYKDALRFVYSNAETYTKEIDPTFCYLTKQYEPIDVVAFLETYKGDLLPKLLDSNDKFLVYEYIDADPIDYISQYEFEELEHLNEELEFTPFYNSMTYNLVRTTYSIKLVDLKHFECKINLPFFIYLYNKDNRVNSLYARKGTDMGPVFQHLGTDYPVERAELIFY